VCFYGLIQAIFWRGNLKPLHKILIERASYDLKAFMEYCSKPDEETISLDYLADLVLFPTIRTAMKIHANEHIVFLDASLKMFATFHFQ